jgi:uncharacterized membrane protein YdbT with pleckstrin-like domain
VAINEKFLNPGEKIIFSTRTHVKALVVPAFIFVVAAGAAGYLLSLTNDKDHKNQYWIAIAVVFVVAVVWFCVRPLLTWLTATYTVTDRRLTTHKGVISRSGHDIPLSRISDVSYEKGILDRILGCGTLVVSDASDRGRVALPDVPRVEEKQLMLSDLLYKGTKNDDGA